MKSIGGYFELELGQGEHYHNKALKLNTARNCLEYILKARQYKKLYIPYYTCEVILEPVKKLKVDYEFYHINQKLEPLKDYELSMDDAFLYTNYFGLKNNEVERLADIYQSKLIVDNSQAFYAMPIEGIDTFYSARKFFGVPDGAYLYTNKYLDEEFEQDISYERMSHLLKRIDIDAESGYNDFKQNDDLLINQPIKKMSFVTEKILESIDYLGIKNKRINNYTYLDEQLKNQNQLYFDYNKEDVPMIYPFFSAHNDLKQKLINNKIFVPTYWNNVKQWTTGEWENFLTDRLVCLPIDQRYSIKAMEQIVNFVKR